MSIKTKMLDSIVGQNMLEKQFQKSFEESDWNESFKILAKIEKL